MVAAIVVRGSSVKLRILGFRNPKRFFGKNDLSPPRGVQNSGVGAFF